MQARLAFTAAFVLLTAAPWVARASDGRFPAERPAIGMAPGNPLTNALDFSLVERELFLDCADGGLHRLSLVDAALIASGVEDAAGMNRYRQQFFAACDEAAALAMHAESPLLRIEIIHHVLHERLLQGGYNANATNLATTLQTGVYNCASATLLFVALAAELNIPAQAIELPGHVRAVVDCGGQQYEVEATCPVWQAAVRKYIADLQAIGTARAVSPCGLVAMIYYNRGIDAFNERRFAEAVAVNRKALLLDSENLLARENLLAAINNWALALCDAHRFAEAETLLTEGEQFDPQHAAFFHNAAHVQQLRMQTSTVAP
ncbi:MAG TPA: hypothetical protein VFE46_08855 [Pirellulales bacterium]|jgi:tetratricopeptide (TPR) repeat protein|nr:hypothetical protein [Pirellulales bacterium]